MNFQKTICRLGVLLIMNLFLISCFSAQVTPKKTARALGNGNWELTSGLYVFGGTHGKRSSSFAGPIEIMDWPWSLIPSHVSGARGFGDRFDLGLNIVKSFGFGINGTFSFISKDEGLSVALTGGPAMFYNLSYPSFYLGPVFSYKSKDLELYLIAKPGVALVSDIEIRIFGHSKVDVTSEGYYFNLQTSLGLNYWFNNKHATSIGADMYCFFGERPCLMMGTLSYIYRTQ